MREMIDSADTEDTEALTGLVVFRATLPSS